MTGSISVVYKCRIKLMQHIYKRPWNDCKTHSFLIRLIAELTDEPQGLILVWLLACSEAGQLQKINLQSNFGVVSRIVLLG